jgi:hypothetical protein
LAGGTVASGALQLISVATRVRQEAVHAFGRGRLGALFACLLAGRFRTLQREADVFQQTFVFSGGQRFDQIGAARLLARGAQVLETAFEAGTNAHLLAQNLEGEGIREQARQ